MILNPLTGIVSIIRCLIIGFILGILISLGMKKRNLTNKHENITRLYANPESLIVTLQSETLVNTIKHKIDRRYYIR